MTRRAKRHELVKALEEFEQAANEPQGFGDNVLQACAAWEIMLHKHKAALTPTTLAALTKRAKVALDKAMQPSPSVMANAPKCAEGAI